MNREILFRGKKKDRKKWIDGYYAVIGAKNVIIKAQGEDYYSVDDSVKKSHGNEVIEIDPETVCQYTGLTDKNGRKIFEGDICKDGDNIVRILWNDKHQWGVEISKTDNVLSKGLIFPLWQYDNCEENGNRQLEVVGNIFDNPELIKE